MEASIETANKRTEVSGSPVKNRFARKTRGDSVKSGRGLNKNVDKVDLHHFRGHHCTQDSIIPSISFFVTEPPDRAFSDTETSIITGI